MFILMLILLIMGISAYRTLPKESTPDIKIPYLIVTVPYPGSSPEDVESLIVHKLESEMQNLDSLKTISSTSTEGAAMISLEYFLGTNIDEAKTDVRDVLDRVKHELPDDAEEPIIKEINFSEFPIMIVNLSSNIGLLRLKNIAEDLEEEIEAIPGILDVTRAGGLDREVKIKVDPDKLRYFNVDLNEVSNAIAFENTNIPAGDISIGPMKYNVRVPNEITHPKDIENLVITAPGQIPIYVKDVATVEFGFREVTSRSRMNRVESISLSVSKRAGENLLVIAEKIKKIVDQKRSKLGDKVNFTITSDHSDNVKSFVKDLENNLYSGLISVLVVLLLILGIRNSLFVAAAIPFSLLISFIILQALGVTLNMVVFFGLIMALGMLVDNAIVVVENIYRHLESGLSPVEAATTGVGEVAIPVITSTLTTLAAFVPLLFMPGISGEFMAYMPKTLIITLSASLFVGLFINPVLCSRIMRKRKTAMVKSETEIAKNSRFFRIYRYILNWSLDHRWLVVVIVIAAWIIVVMSYFKFILPKAGVEFFPVSEPERAIINIEAPFGSTLTTSNRLVKKVEESIKQYQDKTESMVANVGQASGFAFSSNTTHLNHIMMAYPSWEKRTMLPTTIISQVRKIIETFTGAKYTITKTEHGPPTGKAVNIEIGGENLNTLKKVSLEIQRRIKNINGLVNLGDNFAANRSEIQVLIDKETTSRLGLRTAQVAGLIRTAINGKTVSTYRVGKEEYDIIVRLDERYRSSINNLNTLYIKSPMGESVALNELAQIKSSAAMGSIRHKGTDRVITVSGDAEGVSGAVLLQHVRKNLEDYKMPNGYFLKYSGANESQKEMQDFLPKAFMITIFLIFLVLVTQFNSIALPFIIISSVFLSLIGVFLGMIIHSSPISIMMGGIGVISLAGVVVNNAIVLIDYIGQLRKKGSSLRDAIVLGGMLRLRPVILTALTTILALIPITIGLDVSFSRSPVVMLGSESGQMWYMMAQSVIYGLGVATILTLIVVPVLYSIVESGRARFKALFNKKSKSDPPQLSTEKV